MIVSASYRTDIPALHARWFASRLRAGFCRVERPFRRGRWDVVSLARPDVDGFVFWTRNIAPFEAALAEVHARGFPFVVQYTITGYPAALERRVPKAACSVERARALALRYGPRATVWRYDPIVLSSLTPLDFHRENFARLAAALAGATDEAVVSFAQPYRKTVRNLSAAAAEHGFRWKDPPAGEKRALLADLVAIAAENGLRLAICTQPDLLVAGAVEARCIDATRLSDVAGRSVHAERKGVRPGCACYASTDIGAYDTCAQGCVYCYAVSNPERVLARAARYAPASETLQ